MRAHGFLGGDMVDVSAGDAETAVVVVVVVVVGHGGTGAAAEAVAGGIDGGEVGGEGGVAEVEVPAGGYGVAETLWGFVSGFFFLVWGN